MKSKILPLLLIMSISTVTFSATPEQAQSPSGNSEKIIDSTTDAVAKDNLPAEIEPSHDAGKVKGFDPNEPDECSPQGAPAFDSSGNLLPGCIIQNDDPYTIVDFASDFYDGGVRTVECTGISLATAGVCGLNLASVLTCLSLENDIDPSETTPASVCVENSLGDEECTTTEIPDWLFGCGVAIPLAKGCYEIASQVPKYCWE